MLKAVKHYNDVAEALHEALEWAGIGVDYQSKKAKAQRAAFKKIRTMILVGKNAERLLNELRSGDKEVTIDVHRCLCCQEIFIIGNYCEKCSKKKLDEATP